MLKWLFLVRCFAACFGSDTFYHIFDIFWPWRASYSSIEIKTASTKIIFTRRSRFSGRQSPKTVSLEYSFPRENVFFFLFNFKKIKEVSSHTIQGFFRARCKIFVLVRANCWLGQYPQIVSSNRKKLRPFVKVSLVASID